MSLKDTLEHLTTLPLAELRKELVLAQSQLHICERDERAKRLETEQLAVDDGRTANGKNETERARLVAVNLERAADYTCVRDALLAARDQVEAVEAAIEIARDARREHEIAQRDRELELRTIEIGLEAKRLGLEKLSVDLEDVPSASVSETAPPERWEDDLAATGRTQTYTDDDEPEQDHSVNCDEATCDGECMV